MRKLFITIQFIALSIIANAQGEWVSASIGNGASANKVDLYIKTNTTFDSRTIGNLVFTIRTPIMGGGSVTATETYHSPLFTHITFAITKYAVNDGVYYYYLVNGTGNSATGGTNILNTDPPLRVLEISFGGGTSGIVELVNIEMDLPGNNGALLRPQFYVENNLGDITNLTNMFLGTGGAIPMNNANPNGDDWVPTASAVLLPVNFISYDVKCNDKGALLSWSTAGEQNSDRFEIQRSYNSTDWTVIDNLPAAGNTSAQRNYQYLDLKGGAAFYRVRQVDRDGQFIYTAIKRTDCKSTAQDVIIYPVPATDKLTVVIRSDKALKTDLKIIDANGRIVQKVNTQINKETNNIILDVSALPSGSYMLISSDPSLIINKKFTVMR